MLDQSASPCVMIVSRGCCSAKAVSIFRKEGMGKRGEPWILDGPYKALNVGIVDRLFFTGGRCSAKDGIPFFWFQLTKRPTPSLHPEIATDSKIASDFDKLPGTS